MKGRSLILAVLMLSATGLFAQTRTVTNSDLARYRDQRLSAERDLNENYVRLGFPSPEERARRDAEAAHQRDELVVRLRAEELERQRIDAAYRIAEFEATRMYGDRSRQAYDSQYDSDRFYPSSDGSGGYYGSGYGGEYYGNFGNIRGRRQFRGQYQQPGIYEGGMFVPTGPRTPPRPLIRTTPRR